MGKYLFLDFDGVLNTEFYQDLLMSQGKPFRDKHGPFFDPMAVEQLKRVVDSTHADIVIESSWRFLGLEAMQDMWTDRQLPGRVIASAQVFRRKSGASFCGRTHQGF